MNADLQRAIAGAIMRERDGSPVVEEINLSADGGGTIKYRPEAVWIDPSSPGFNRYATQITDEEMVRAYLLHRLTTTLQYEPNPQAVELERVYKPVGRPVGKGGRVDVLVRRPPKKSNAGGSFLFIECKEPEKFDSDMRFIDGQLFRLSMLEVPRPKYLVYYTVDLRRGELRERIILVDTEAFPGYEAWDAAGQPIIDVLPARYGSPSPRRYANVATATPTLRPLDTTATAMTLNRIRSEIHDVIWGGGGTNNNEVFVYITKLTLCKIFDEKETAPGAEYRFQRRGDAISPEPPLALAERMNALYREAEVGYLALSHPSDAPAFDFARISPAKVAYVVGRLEDISITDNVHGGDLLGEFFEQIVSQDFTQSKGQFFTPMHIVRFMLQLLDVGTCARNVVTQQRDRLGRPRLPYIIDPSVGSGSFLIEYMKSVSAALTDRDFVSHLPARIREYYGTWFHERNRNAWAREFVYAIENNYDLGLAAKVNMVLHGDGSMNTFICSGLLPFGDYWVDGRTNLLAIGREPSGATYTGTRNEQFDIVISNPPFSLTMSPDERDHVRTAFPAMGSSISEKIFIERWYQLLSPGGVFCCVLPETILDTLVNGSTRQFLYQHFKIIAVVALPYDAFRPFTSTKTCIVFAQRRTDDEAARWREEWDRALVICFTQSVTTALVE